MSIPKSERWRMQDAADEGAAERHRATVARKPECAKISSLLMQEAVAFSPLTLANKRKSGRGKAWAQVSESP